MSSATRVTEATNPLTEGLDLASPDDLVRMLAACDAQLFVGSNGLPGLYSDVIVSAAADGALAIASTLAHPRGHVIIAGCGTSGRLAHLLARDMNAAVPGRRFGYLLAGGDGALLVPQEAVEDSATAALADLDAWLAQIGALRTDPLVVIGVSCGLSATYVGALLAATLEEPTWHAVAVGFNPIDAIASVRVPGWGDSFHGVLTRMQHPQAGSAFSRSTRGIVLNPVVGPEAVSGSSRMKGGSATLLLLAPVCQLGARLAAAPPPHLDKRAVAALLRGAMLQLEAAVRRLYATESLALAVLVKVAAQSLTTRRPIPSPPPPWRVTPTGWGRIIYVGGGHAGLFGLIDASEATDTYGSAFNEVRAFCEGGWAAMDVRPGVIHPFVPPELRRTPSGSEQGTSEVADPALQSFMDDIVPTLGTADVVFMLHLEEDMSRGSSGPTDAVLAAGRAARNAGATVRHVVVMMARDDVSNEHVQTGGVDSGFDMDSDGIVVRLPSLRLQWAAVNAVPPLTNGELIRSPLLASNTRSVHSSSPSSLGSLVLKLALNAITTGAHIARGVVIRNIMVNMVRGVRSNAGEQRRLYAVLLTLHHSPPPQMLTNHKLYLRACRIVEKIAGATSGEAERAVLRAIYNEDDTGTISARVADGNIEAHISRASVTENVIPVAVLLASASGTHRSGTGMTVAAARNALIAQPVVRLAILR